MFFQEPTPDTSGYLIAGYAVAFIVMALYVASIYLRSRNLRQDMSLLEDLEKSAPSAVPSVKPKPRKSSSRSEANRAGKPVTKKSRKK
jgi:hypothetical protein